MRKGSEVLCDDGIGDDRYHERVERCSKNGILFAGGIR